MKKKKKKPEREKGGGDKSSTQGKGMSGGVGKEGTVRGRN